MVGIFPRAAVILMMTSGAAYAQMPNAPQPPQQGPAQPVADFAQVKSVPHGEVRVIWYRSATYGVQRRMHIYLPPGYEKGARRYPVLYLIHGGGQDDAAWTDDGQADFIMDNLVAAGQVKPMIVVMPDGSGVDGNGQGKEGPPPSLPEREKASSGVRDGFIDDLRVSIIPYVDGHYRTRPGRESRAIAGFSFGGAEALWAGTGHPEAFAYIGVFSMGIQGGSNADPNAIAGSGSSLTRDGFVADRTLLFRDIKTTNHLTKLFWIGAGSDDQVVGNGPRILADTLTAHGIRHEYHETAGGHDYTNWRAYLRSFAQLLFK